MAGFRHRLLLVLLVPGEKPMPPVTVRVVARGPVRSKGPGAINRQLDTFKAAIERSGAKVEEAFVAVLAPGWLDHFIFNEYYKTEEEFLFALADALREEYRAVVAAGFILQIDDPGLPDWWDMLKPEPTIAAYRKFARLRIDAVNRALVGIPEERVRYHLCWGSWHGPHTHDLPLEHIIDLILEVKAQTYSFEAGNVRHEHEWRVWQQAKLPAGKMLMPGVVSHATNLVEHPQLVADRILRYAAIVGRENVIAGTDCGLGGRVHADLAWAKLRTLVEGAQLASSSLWP
jgi:5-methyltetrahydropteroyltriglutamate--homocysteine methyltransferase